MRTPEDAFAHASGRFKRFLREVFPASLRPDLEVIPPADDDDVALDAGLALEVGGERDAPLVVEVEFLRRGVEERDDGVEGGIVLRALLDRKSVV